MSRIAILKKIRTKYQNRVWLSINFTACRLVLLSHFNRAKLFNDYILLVSGKVPPRKIAPRLWSEFGLGLALELGLEGNFPRGKWPLLKMTIKTGLFSFWFPVVLLLRYSDIIDHYCIMENYGKSGKNKNKVRAI